MCIWELSTETNRIEAVVGGFEVAAIFATVIFRGIYFSQHATLSSIYPVLSFLSGIVPIAFAGVMCGCYVIPDFRPNPGSFKIQRIAGISSYTLNHRRDDVYQRMPKLILEKLFNTLSFLRPKK